MGVLAAGMVALAGCGSGSSNPLRLAAEGPTTTLAGAAPTTTADATAPSGPGASGAAGSTTVAGSSTTAAATTTTEVRPGVDALAAIALTTQPIADIEKLTAMAVRPGDTSIYVTTQTGQVYRIPKGGAPVKVLDLTGTVSEYETGSERGMLGLAFSPVDGRMFLYYTDLQAQAHLVSYAVGDDGIPDPDSVWKVLDIAEPGAGHKGGGINITDDGDALPRRRRRRRQPRPRRPGHDQDAGCDPAHRPVAPPAPATPCPTTTRTSATPPRRPRSSPRACATRGGSGVTPSPTSCGSATSGEDTVEELNRIPDTQTGANFGWYFVEGDHVRYQGAPADVVAPLFTYRHDDIGPAIIGGRVYRGARSGARRRLRVRRHGRSGDGGGRLRPGRHAHGQPAERGDHRLRHRPRQRALRAHPPRRPVQDRPRLNGARSVRRAELAVAGVAEAGDDERVLVEVARRSRR